MTEADVVVLGAGLAGMSTAYHLRLRDPKLKVLVLEKKDRPGGLAGSLTRDGFTFDYTGHLLHLHDPYGKQLILDLLKENVQVHDRSSWIFSHGAYTRYPFQANTWGLPARVVDDCVLGFLKAARHDLPFRRPRRQRPLGNPPIFGEWCLQTFGEGISRHFMTPYNEKLWKVPLSRMTAEWVAPFVPRPKVEEVLYGALADQKKFFGYNASFRYPKRGGTQALSDALAERVADCLHLGCPVESIDFTSRTVLAANVGSVRYRHLINTMPLTSLLDSLEGLPAGMRPLREGLGWTTLHCLNLGVARAGVSDKHWVYFPEKRYPFYRVGFYSNFSKHVAPPGTSSLYVEHSARPGQRFDKRRMLGRSVDALEACGLLKRSDRLAVADWTTVPVAYVTYDRHRARALPRIIAWLKAHRIATIGRYGAWKYSFMEEAIMDGKRCAERILGIAPSGPAHRPRPQEELKALK